MTPEHQQAEREALKGCPMCGCAATFVKHSAGLRGTRGFDQWDAVACKHCRLTIGACDRRFRNRDDAAAAWNRRAGKRADVVPLSENQIDTYLNFRASYKAQRYWFVRGARFAEAAHGIGIATSQDSAKGGKP